MKLDFLFVIGTFVGIFYTVLFPAQILGDDPTGLDGVRNDKIKEYISAQNSSYILGFNDVTGEILTRDGKFQDIEGLIDATDNNAGVITTDLGFGFLDYIKVGWALLKSLLRFLLAFIYLSWSLPNPLNILVGLPLIFGYIFAGVSYIMGRA
jgi:hypothetical protein